MAAERFYLPETPEELTASWLSDALGHPVSGVRQQVLGDGIGFMGDVLRLHLEYADGADGPQSVVVKLPKKENRVMGELLGVYEREIMFFRSFGEDSPLRIPQMYYSEFDRDKGSEKQAEILRGIDKLPRFFSRAINFLGSAVAASKKRRYMLIIEFLDNMRPGDQLAGLDLSGCEQVVVEIAALHKKYWASENLSEHFWLLELDIDARLRHGIFKQHVDAFSRGTGSGMIDKLAWLKESGAELTRSFVAGAPTTLLHCDLRLDNVVFDGSHCAFIDWQLVRTGPAAFDIAYFITSAMQVEASSADVDKVLRAYHTALDVADYSFEQFWLDYQRGLMCVLANLTGVEQVELGDGRGKQMMDMWMQRLAARLSDVDLENLITSE